MKFGTRSTSAPGIHGHKGKGGSAVMLPNREALDKLTSKANINTYAKVTPSNPSPQGMLMREAQAGLDVK